jgi:hypothetical protein
VREKAASDAFNTVIGQFPSGFPHLDGSERIQNASLKLIAARKEMGRVHSRLNTSCCSCTPNDPSMTAQGERTVRLKKSASVRVAA